MLFEFHKQQNSKKAGSVHALYLVCGLLADKPSAVSTQIPQTDGEDAHMQSSPFMSSSIPQKDDVESESAAVSSVVICQEEDLEGGSSFRLLCNHV